MDNRRQGNCGKRQNNKVKDVNGLVLIIVFSLVRFYFFLSGIRVRLVNKIGKPEKPSIILCTHGSFIDFIYAASLIGKYKPNFIVARLYFYNTLLGRLLRSLGAFPKSMFATDLENVKNCLTVLREKNHLGMMPEARLSTTGRFEDIQDATFSFIKKSAVSVYTVRFSGDYFAKPKWGRGCRRGALVEAKLDILYTADEVKSLSSEELKKGIEDRLYYNEFEWLKKHPEIHYRSRRMAEGLENILTVCPVCKRRHSLKTKGRRVYCDGCGYLTSLDDRYNFDSGFCFTNLAEWYDWQKAALEKEILQNEDYTLTSEVELRLPSYGRGLTRHGGRGVCTLTRDGLVYSGTKDGETVKFTFSMARIYRLLFGAGENFEIYNGTEILYFVPTEKRSCVDWYMASMILHDEAAKSTPKEETLSK